MDMDDLIKRLIAVQVDGISVRGSSLSGRQTSSENQPGNNILPGRSINSLSPIRLASKGSLASSRFPIQNSTRVLPANVTMSQFLSTADLLADRPEEKEPNSLSPSGLKNLSSMSQLLSPMRASDNWPSPRISAPNAPFQHSKLGTPRADPFIQIARQPRNSDPSALFHPSKQPRHSVDTTDPDILLELLRKSGRPAGQVERKGEAVYTKHIDRLTAPEVVQLLEDAINPLQSRYSSQQPDLWALSRGAPSALMAREGLDGRSSQLVIQPGGYQMQILSRCHRKSSVPGNIGYGFNAMDQYEISATEMSQINLASRGRLVSAPGASSVIHKSSTSNDFGSRNTSLKPISNLSRQGGGGAITCVNDLEHEVCHFLFSILNSIFLLDEPDLTNL